MQGADQRKHQSSASLAFGQGIHRWPANSPHKRLVTRKMFPFDDVILTRNDLGILCVGNKVFKDLLVTLSIKYLDYSLIYGLPKYLHISGEAVQTIWFSSHSDVSIIREIDYRNPPRKFSSGIVAHCPDKTNVIVVIWKTHWIHNRLVCCF